MSYILEALEKSEQERKQRAVPDLQTQPTLYPGITRSRPRRVVKTPRRLGPAILLGLAFVLSAWLLRDHLPVELEIKITRQAPQATAPAPDLVSAPAPQPASLPQAAPADTSPSLAVQQTGQEGQHNIPAQQTAPTSSSNRETLSADVVEETEQDEMITPYATTPAPTGEQNLVARAKVTLQPAPIMLADAGNPEAITVAEPLPFLDELPAAQQQELPIMKFAGHTYSAIAGDRLIIINNGIKREGDAVGPGLKLEEITWDGVILNYRGLRFQVVTTGS